MARRRGLLCSGYVNAVLTESEGSGQRPTPSVRNPVHKSEPQRQKTSAQVLALGSVRAAERTPPCSWPRSPVQIDPQSMPKVLRNPIGIVACMIWIENSRAFDPIATTFSKARQIPRTRVHGRDRAVVERSNGHSATQRQTRRRAALGADHSAGSVVGESQGVEPRAHKRAGSKERRPSDPNLVCMQLAAHINPANRRAQATVGPALAIVPATGRFGVVIKICESYDTRNCWIRCEENGSDETPARQRVDETLVTGAFGKNRGEDRQHARVSGSSGTRTDRKGKAIPSGYAEGPASVAGTGSLTTSGIASQHQGISHLPSATLAGTGRLELVLYQVSQCRFDDVVRVARFPRHPFTYPALRSTAASYSRGARCFKARNSLTRQERAHHRPPCRGRRLEVVRASRVDNDSNPS